MQVGDLRGLELIAHYAGEMARTFRRSDGEVRATAARLATYLQTCLRVYAEDTAPIPQPVFVDVTVADRSGSGGVN
ncbi:MAG: hypothetical protein IPL61_12640 [Myxococcales bacterium]|nr:hypothetical protein [Myxococcales bacterium]